jgi:thiol-disulfide isomerase/thioredoxin
MKKLVFFFLLNALITNAFSQKALPDLMVKTLEGQSVNVRSLAKAGQVTVFNFWATWCAPCQKELSAIAPKYAEWQKNYKVELVAVTIDNSQGLPKVKPMVAQKKWAYTIVSDANSQLLNQLGAQNVPFTVLVNQKGQIIYTHNAYKAGDELTLEAKIKEAAAQ